MIKKKLQIKKKKRRDPRCTKFRFEVIDAVKTIYII